MNLNMVTTFIAGKMTLVGPKWSSLNSFLQRFKRSKSRCEVRCIISKRSPTLQEQDLRITGRAAAVKNNTVDSILISF